MYSKTSSRRLQDVSARRLPSRSLQEVFKTSARRRLAIMSGRHLQDILRSLERKNNVMLKTFSTCLQDVFSTYSPRRMFAGSRDARIFVSKNWISILHCTIFLLMLEILKFIERIPYKNFYCKCLIFLFTRLITFFRCSQLFFCENQLA